ncbi:MAG: choice-of-anchor J domain-containing protein [Eubacteriaceae bacterium]
MKKRILSLLLCLTLVLSVIPSSVFAQDTSKKTGYLALGDSIATGYGLTDYTDANKKSINSYPTLLSTCFDQNTPSYTNLAVDGMTSSDLLSRLKDDTGYQNAVASAGSITISIGSNDLLGPFQEIVANAFNCKVSELQTTVTGLIQNALNNDSIALLTLFNATGKLESALDPNKNTDKKLNEDLLKACNDYKDNLNKIVQEIKVLNSDARIYVSNIYNPYKGCDIIYNGTSFLNLETLTEPYITKINEAFGAASSEYTLVDVYSVIKDSTADLTNSSVAVNSYSLDPHPNAAGHKEIASAFAKVMDFSGGVKSLPWSDSFEKLNFQSLPVGWTFKDKDSDGNGWTAASGSAQDEANAMVSASVNDKGQALTPDNWMISPAISVNGNTTLKYHVTASDIDKPEEKYQVLVSTTGTDENDFTVVSEEKLTSGKLTQDGDSKGYLERTAVLSQYSGQNIYIAFRHYGSTNQSALCIDNVSVGKSVEITGDLSKVYDGKAVEAPAYTSMLNGAVTVEYTVKDGNHYTTTAPREAGSYTVRVTVNQDGNNQASDTKDFTISPKQLTISGTTAQNKIYDGTTAATVTPGTVTGIVDGDKVNVSGSGVFSSPEAGAAAQTVQVVYTLTGDDAGNYTTVADDFATAVISPKELTVHAVVKDKQYDGTTTAAFDSAPTLDGVITGDDVRLVSGVPEFKSSAVGDDIPISLSTPFSMDGTAAANYTLKQPGTLTASIYNKYQPAAGTDYTASSNDWSNQDFVVTAKDGYLLSTTNTAEGSWSQTLSASDETDKGTLSFYVKNTSTGAISSQVSEPYKIDKTAPAGTVSISTSSWRTFLNQISFGLFFNDTQTVSVTADPDTSGIEKIETVLADKALSLEEVKNLTGWQQGSKRSISLEDARQFVCYVRLTDKAGNVTYLSTDGAEYDTTPPVISGVSSSTYYTTQTADAADKNLSLVTVNGQAVPSPVTLDGNTDAVYALVAEDKAGNTTTCTVTMKPVDSLAASIAGITVDNVKVTDQAAIETVRQNAQALDLTGAAQSEKDAVQAILDNCDTLLQKISELQKQADQNKGGQTGQDASSEAVGNSTAAATDNSTATSGNAAVNAATGITGSGTPWGALLLVSTAVLGAAVCGKHRNKRTD